VFWVLSYAKRLLKSTLKSTRAFIGPIGDDLPSFIPILTAMMIFFASFTYTYNTFQLKNREFDTVRTAISISRTIMGHGHIADINEFINRMNKIESPYHYYVAILVNLPMNVELVDHIEEEGLDSVLNSQSSTTSSSSVVGGSPLSKILRAPRSDWQTNSGGVGPDLGGVLNKIGKIKVGNNGGQGFGINDGASEIIDKIGSSYKIPHRRKLMNMEKQIEKKVLNFSRPMKSRGLFYDPWKPQTKSLLFSDDEKLSPYDESYWSYFISYMNSYYEMDLTADSIESLLEDVAFVGQEGYMYVATNLDEVCDDGPSECAEDWQKVFPDADEKLVSLVYPVVLQDGFNNYLMRLVVLVWEK